MQGIRAQHQARANTVSEDYSVATDGFSSRGPSSPDPASAFLHNAYFTSYWQDGTFDLEAGCVPWTYARDDKMLSWIPSSFFGSKLEQKIRNPGSSDAIGYSMRPTNTIVDFLWRFFFDVYLLLVSILVPQSTRTALRSTSCHYLAQHNTALTACHISNQVAGHVVVRSTHNYWSLLSSCTRLLWASKHAL